METRLSKRSITIIILITISLMVSNIKGVTTVFAQINSTNIEKVQNKSIDYITFHSHIQEVIGHIKKAIYNKINGDDKLAFAHIRHPIDELLPTITIPLNNTNKKLNNTYVTGLSKLSDDTLPGNNNVTKEEFIKNAQSYIDLSNKVIDNVIPLSVLKNPNHNVTVIQNLLKQSVQEYGEGVEKGKVIDILELQDAQAFVNGAQDVFNNTKSVSYNEAEISSMFNDLNNSINQHIPQSEIGKMVYKINQELSLPTSKSPIMLQPSSSLSNISTSFQSSSSKVNNTYGVNANITALDYISKIRSLLNQTLYAYKSGDYAKAKDLATTGYIDNFEFIEKAIGPELKHQGEELFRIKLRSQIDAKVPLEEIKSSIEQINKLLDKAATTLTY